MATIVEFPEHRNVNRYARRYHERDEAGAQILLFTGVRYERSDSDDSAPAVKSRKRSAKKTTRSASSRVKRPKSAV